MPLKRLRRLGRRGTFEPSFPCCSALSPLTTQNPGPIQPRDRRSATLDHAGTTSAKSIGAAAVLELGLEPEVMTR
jgi:hypothetical protein